MVLTEKQFSNLYKKYYSKISRYVSAKINNKEDAQELVEDVFIKVSQKYQLYNEKESQLSTWIYNIAKNVLIDHFRRPKLNTLSIDVPMDYLDGFDAEYAEHIEVVDKNLDPLESLMQDEKLNAVNESMKKLNSLEKKLITMYAFKGMSYSEIVDKLDIPLGTVKGTIHRARAIIRESVPNLATA